MDSTEVIENYGKITGGAHNFGKIADSVISLSLLILSSAEDCMAVFGALGL